METLTVTCHEEAGVWWAEVLLEPGFYATAPDFESLQVEVRNGLAFLKEDWMPRLRFIDASGAALDSQSLPRPTAAQWWTITAVQPVASVSAPLHTGTSVRSAQVVGAA